MQRKLLDYARLTLLSVVPNLSSKNSSWNLIAIHSYLISLLHILVEFLVYCWIKFSTVFNSRNIFRYNLRNTFYFLQTVIIISLVPEIGMVIHRMSEKSKTLKIQFSSCYFTPYNIFLLNLKWSFLVHSMIFQTFFFSF